MKPVYSLAFLGLLIAATACSGEILDDASYDNDVCEDLAVKIERHDSISQPEYEQMICQNAAILRFLIEKSRKIAEEPQGDRPNSWRDLLADPEYMERFSYMFTLGSALYQAEVDGRLDEKNTKLYKKLDRYNQELVEYSERN
jgi:hypothetical protein